MEKKYKKCPHCLEKIQAQAIKCRYCEEWLDKEDEEKDKELTSEVKIKPSKFKKIKSFAARIILWSLIFSIWQFYAFITLDHSDEAGPYPSGYSVFILGFIFALLLRKVVFSKSKKLWNISIKIIVFLIIVLGLAMQIEHDPTLSKLNEYRKQEEALFIPAQHQQERFGYLELSGLEIKSNKTRVDATAKLKNNSYIYDMKDVTARFDFYADEKSEQLIESTRSAIESIQSRGEVDLSSSIESAKQIKAWTVTIENTTLVNK